MKAVRAIFKDHTVLCYTCKGMQGAAVAGVISFMCKPRWMKTHFDNDMNEWIEALNDCDDLESIEIIE